MVLSILEDTRLQGAGTQGKVQGMGGVTLELEVLTARGYSRTSYSDGMTKLDQEDPGAGDLVIRFTASLTEGGKRGPLELQGASFDRKDQ